MIRLKQINVNGIRGFKYLQDKENNPTPHIIKFNNKHLFLYGENGTGKSSFCDALEWGLTGAIEESSYRRTDEKGLLVNSFCPSEKVPSVEIHYLDGNNLKKFVREYRRGNISFDFEDESKLCFIESTRIERFVISTTKSKWDRFSELLGFENLVILDDKLKRLRNYSEEKNSSAKKVLDISERSIIDLKAEIGNLEQALSKDLGNQWISTTNNFDFSIQKDKYARINKLLSDVADYIEKHKQIKDIIKNITIIEEKLNEERQKTPTSEISKIIEEAFNYFQTIENLKICPICGNEIAFSNTFDHVKKLKSSFDKIISYEKDFEILLQEKKYGEKRLSELEISIRYLYTSLYNEDIQNDFSDNEFCDFLSRKKEALELKKNQLEKMNSQERMIFHYQDKVKSLSEKEEQFEEQKRDLEIIGSLSKDIDLFYEIYTKKYSEIIRRELDSICDNEITSIYNEINKSSDEIVEKFSIDLNIDKKEIDILINMKGLPDKLPALNVLSTGHIRCLGFALLIARIQIKAKNLGFLVIDDPIYSIDHEHRYNLIQYLKKLGNTYQLIITSSDRLFSDLIRNSFDSNIFVFYKSKMSKREGIIYFKLKERSKYRNYIREAEEHMRLKDFRAASLYTRLSFETKIFDLAKKLKIMIPYDRIEKHSIRDIMSNGLKESLISAYPIHEDRIKNEFEKLARPEYFKTLLDGFPLDPEIHYPHEARVVYCQQEIEEALDMIREFDKFMGDLGIK